MNKIKELYHKHVILSHPIIGALFIIALGTIYYSIIGSTFSEIINTGNFEIDEIIYYLVFIICSLLLLIIHKLWFKNEYKGSLSFDNFLNKSVLVSIIIYFVCDIIQVILSINELGYVPANIVSILISISAGTSEEILFRVLPISIMMRYYKDHNKYLLALILTSILFGLTHLGNINSGASLITSIHQALGSIISGLLFGALYLKTGSILWSLILHSFHDIINMQIAGQSTGIMLNTIGMFDLVSDGVFAIMEIILVIYLLKGHKDEIMDNWKKIWNKKPQINI